MKAKCNKGDHLSTVNHYPIAVTCEPDLGLAYTGYIKISIAQAVFQVPKPQLVTPSYISML